MDCRKFQRDLEDYLQGDMDFAGLFGMERHAQQCISCGKMMSRAQRLSQMAQELKPVRAPSNFESSILDEIAKRKLRHRFWGIRRYWIYGLERPSWGKLALAASSLAILVLAVLYPINQKTIYQSPELSKITGEPADAGQNLRAPSPPAVELKSAAAPEIFREPAAVQPSIPQQGELSEDRVITDLEFVEFHIEGSDNPPVIMPKKIRMQYGQASEEYFIRNVSH
jgi:hypothetical protein